MGLAAPHTEAAVKFVDKVGGIEWLIENYEIDGASALKLDLALDTPIIIVPRNSMSKELVVLQLIPIFNLALFYFCFYILDNNQDAIE